MMTESEMNDAKKCGYLKALIDVCKVIENCNEDELKNRYRLMNKVIVLKNKFE